ncbi:hypothetical protein SAMN06297251_102159 [Fulvimarina manganoxydans]|uniref:Uncharacterized protein n=1 Tax=Fulvimarina manganoxydans TaxID=937218 RepID=A0A1W1Z4R1_9HYPH|nr:hypothetical protein SAMN06297251_102159 [Fulvimarina manganoxydans]
MNLLGFLTRRNDKDEVARREVETCLEQERGDLRNTVQTIHSHSRRLTLMAGVMEMRGHGHEEAS